MRTTKAQECLAPFGMLEEEVLDMGLYEYLDSGYLCLLEWPEKILNLLPEKVGIVKIEGYFDQRDITFIPETDPSLYF